MIRSLQTLLYKRQVARLGKHTIDWLSAQQSGLPLAELMFLLSARKRHGIHTGTLRKLSESAMVEHYFRLLNEIVSAGYDKPIPAWFSRTTFGRAQHLVRYTIDDIYSRTHAMLCVTDDGLRAPDALLDADAVGTAAISRHAQAGTATFAQLCHTTLVAAFLFNLFSTGTSYVLN